MLDLNSLHCGPGNPAPLGAAVSSGGVNFSLFSRTATGVELLLFDGVNDNSPRHRVALDRVANHTYHYWHVFVPNLKPGQIYGYRVHGPGDPHTGSRFDSDKVLLDPYGRAVVIPDAYTRTAARDRGDNAATAMKSVVVDTSAYDWQGDAPLRRPSASTIIYEVHVRGFTRNPNSNVAAVRRGTYAGVIEKIPYLQELGVNAVELLPVFAFDTQDCPPGLVNYWGYAPISFFAPHPAYSSCQDPQGTLDEFRDMVKALHRAGIEVILDVVYNHSAEGNHNGPTVCFRGIDNSSYYMLEPDGVGYKNYTGCGNTFNSNHPVVRRLIIDSLRYWVTEMHVDGFRFDLASILSRDSKGDVLPNPPVLWDIESEPTLAGIKLIAEAWDAAGLYQVGAFVGDAWKEWNGKFRDDARDFFRGQPGAAGRMADRLLGSHALYGHKRREAEQSVNFVTCHDGFTLNDLVSYNEKHNEPNGEQNRDGANDNASWNCGVEGPTNDPAVEALRNRQVKNFFTATVLALGMPMFVMGDEVRRTQQGNNNAYCHDDETTWFDWSLLAKHADIRRFVRLLLERRLRRDVEYEQHRVSLTELIELARTTWHGIKLNQPDWSPQANCLALSVETPKHDLAFYLIMNSHWEPQEFELPATFPSHPWRRWIDTARPSPEDITQWDVAPTLEEFHYAASERSVVVLLSDGIRPV